MRFFIFALLFIAAAAFSAIGTDAQVATQSCAATRGAQPCICNNPGLNPNGCICRDNTCLGGAPITCASQCGNGVVNENSNTSSYRISKNPRVCGVATGCDAVDVGQDYKTCSEVCDSGAALGTFKNGVCCTRTCGATRNIDEFDMWNITPLQCQTPADCLDAPGHTITCEPARRPWEGSWCKYVPNAGTIPFISVNGKQVCPVYPCFTTKWSYGSCMKNLDRDNRADMTNPFQGGGSWYNMNVYDGVCNQPTSTCWTKPSCYRGTLTAVPTGNCPL